MVGFDINEAALRFTALGLYLLSIELDPNPRPVDKLRFDHLRGTVLHRVKGMEGEEGTALGSLGPLVGEEHEGRYDLVIGNPPWASGTSCRNGSMSATESRISRRPEESQTQPTLPNEALDLPFVWRAMEWLSQAGRLPSRCTRACSFSKVTGCRPRGKPCSSAGREFDRERRGTEADEGMAADLGAILYFVCYQ